MENDEIVTGDDNAPTGESVLDTMMGILDEGEEGTQAPQQVESSASQDALPPSPPPVEIRRPRSWGKDTWEKFDAMPQELRDYVLKREDERDLDYDRKVSELNTRQGPLNALIEEYQDLFPDKTLPPDALRWSLEVRRRLQNDPEQGLRDIASSMGLSLEDIVGGVYEKPPAIPQYVSELQKELRELKDWRRQEAESRQSYIQDQNMEVVSVFATEKDSSGALLRPYYAEVAEDMIGYVQQAMARNPKAPKMEILKDAYDRATWANPSIRQKLLDSKKLETREQSLTSLPSSHNGTTAPKKKARSNSVEDLMLSILDGSA